MSPGTAGDRGWRDVWGRQCPMSHPGCPFPRLYRVYGKKNVKLEPVALKGTSLDPR